MLLRWWWPQRCWRKCWRQWWRWLRRRKRNKQTTQLTEADSSMVGPCERRRRHISNAAGRSKASNAPGQFFNAAAGPSELLRQPYPREAAGVSPRRGRSRSQQPELATPVADNDEAAICPGPHQNQLHETTPGQAVASCGPEQAGGRTWECSPGTWPHDAAGDHDGGWRDARWDAGGTRGGGGGTLGGRLGGTLGGTLGETVVSTLVGTHGAMQLPPFALQILSCVSALPRGFLPPLAVRRHESTRKETVRHGNGSLQEWRPPGSLEELAA